MAVPPDWKDRFLAMLRDTSNVRLSCRAAGIDRRSCYKARDKSPEFAARWADALEDGVDVLEAKARERAIQGSDYLLLALLKAHRRDVYGDRVRNEHSGPDSGPIAVTAVDPDKQRKMVLDPEAARYAAQLDECLAAGDDPGGVRP